MLSAGIFSALAAAIAVRRRGFESGSPPPLLAAIAISLIRRVKILPRLASSAPFLCLIVAHFEWPDMGIPRSNDLKFRDLRSRPQRRSQDSPRTQTVQAKRDYSMGRTTTIISEVGFARS